MSNTPKDVVLLTGFGPFRGHTTNASWEVVKEVARTGIETELDIKLVTEEIPVVYSVVAERIPALWKKHQPTLVVHLGVSSIASGLTIETRAFNHGYTSFDVNQQTPCNACCTPGGGEVIECLLDVPAMCQAVRKSESQLTSQSSSFAGRFLCEFCYYISLSMDHQRTVFVHVPTLDQGIPVSTMASGLVAIVREALQQIKSKV